MNRFDWLQGFVGNLRAQGIRISEREPRDLGRAQLLAVKAADWGQVAGQAARDGLRFAGVWAEQREEGLVVNASLARRGEHLVLRTALDISASVLPSYTPHYPAADRMERHVRDLFSIRFVDHPDPRRWTRHQAWPETSFPLHKDYPVPGQSQAATPADSDYPFIQSHGAGVCEIPVGPVHAGIIEPGHFRFQAVGETVLHLEERLGYVHKGIEKIAEGRDPEGLVRLAGRVSGDSTVGHAWAACMAMETVADVDPPPRALALRAVMAERERIANHLGDIGAICNDVSFTFAHYQFSRLRELWQRASAGAFGHRLMVDQVVPGGVKSDLALEQVQVLRAGLDALRHELDALYPILNDHPSLEDRLASTGMLPVAIAARLGTLGYVGKASGQDLDLRRDNPYPPYDQLTVRVPLFESGDVAARLKVRAEEVLVSLGLLEVLLGTLPDGPVRAAWRVPEPGAEGLGLVEGWRGEILSYVRFAADNRIARFFPRDPSWFNWPALEQLVLGNIVPDFPVCNKSVNGSYSGHDL